MNPFGGEMIVYSHTLVCAGQVNRFQRVYVKNRGIIIIKKNKSAIIFALCERVLLCTHAVFDNDIGLITPEK